MAMTDRRAGQTERRDSRRLTPIQDRAAGHGGCPGLACPGHPPGAGPRHYPAVCTASTSCAAGAFTDTSTAFPRVVVTSL